MFQFKDNLIIPSRKEFTTIILCTFLKIEFLHESVRLTCTTITTQPKKKLGYVK